jgi:hypothetical protein
LLIQKIDTKSLFDDFPNRKKKQKNASLLIASFIRGGGETPHALPHGFCLPQVEEMSCFLVTSTNGLMQVETLFDSGKVI